jgi:hypothetical protein
MQGESSGFGLRGLEIELPSLRLRFPSITLPSAFRTRESARMIVHESHAPYLEGQAYLAYGAAPQWAPAYQRSAAQNLERLEQLRGALRDAQDQAESQMRADLNAARAAEEAMDNRLEDINEAEQRLDEKIRRLQECLQDLMLLEAKHADRLSASSRRCPPAKYATSAYLDGQPHVGAHVSYEAPRPLAEPGRAERPLRRLPSTRAQW